MKSPETESLQHAAGNYPKLWHNCAPHVKCIIFLYRFLYENNTRSHFWKNGERTKLFVSSSCFTFLSKKICQSHDWCTIAQKVYFQITTSFKINSIWNMRNMSSDNSSCKYIDFIETFKYKDMLESFNPYER